MLRRTFLQLLGSAIAFVVAPPKLKALEPPLFAPQEPLRPFWCPEGFLPLHGQQITRKDYPDLFEIIKIGNGKSFWPRYWNQDSATFVTSVPRLPVAPPSLPELLQKHGWQDHLTFNPKPPNDTIAVSCIATKHMRRHNGTTAYAGFQVSLEVSQADYEKTYGPITEVVPIPFGYRGNAPVSEV